MSDQAPPQEGEIELDESFDEQKRKVDEWTRQEKGEDEEKQRDPA